MGINKINIIVLTGDHPFQEKEFDALFQNMEGINYTRQELSDFVNSPDQDKYQSLVFYNFHQYVPDEKTANSILKLTERGQGLVILHHAILAFPDWKEFENICGISDRKFGYHIGEKIKVHVEDHEHPVTKGLEDWEMVDEIYTMKSPGQDSRILLTCDHPKSMDAIAWVREYGKSQVLCLQSGHDNETYSVPQFQQVLYRGICWSAGK
ncbi:hypothetical protein GF312_18895 [Candidatus Poribacteria bacterium]|nr:hypothetical protein [Candidatus Poribacteria bacterium]